MSKKEEFKEFAKSHKNLIDYVNSGETSWQQFYEMYDIYGDDEEVWGKYPFKDKKETSIRETLKNIDVDALKGHIDNAQKAIDIISELTKKDSASINPVEPKVPRPITNFFKD